MRTLFHFFSPLRYFFELIFRTAANGTYPVSRQFFKRCPGRNSTRKVSFLRIIDIAAYHTPILIHFLLPFTPVLQTGFSVFHRQGIPSHRVFVRTVFPELLRLRGLLFPGHRYTRISYIDTFSLLLASSTSFFYSFVVQVRYYPISRCFIQVSESRRPYLKDTFESPVHRLLIFYRQSIFSRFAGINPRHNNNPSR